MIFIGRMFAAKLNTLGIVSGAFGAFRRTAVQRSMGWDVGPGEDGDLVLRLRKSNWRIAAQPYAMCFTNLPTSWVRLFKQRRRWDWSVVTFECRKHVDLANVWAPSFSWSNLAMVAERWLYNIVLPYLTWGYLAWMAFDWNRETGFLLLLYYVIFVGFELLQFGLVAYYSNDWRRDLSVAVVAPLMPFYYLYLRSLGRGSHRGTSHATFLPRHLRSREGPSGNLALVAGRRTRAAGLNQNVARRNPTRQRGRTPFPSLTRRVICRLQCAGGRTTSLRHDRPDVVAADRGQTPRNHVMSWIEWYDGLAKPTWTPAPATIGLVWRILYPIIVITFGYVFVQAFRGKIGWMVALPFAINLVANLIFTPIQFGMRNLPLASLDILIVWGTILWMMAAIWPHYRWVAAAQIPYFLWVSIATVLQLSITWNN